MVSKTEVKSRRKSGGFTLIELLVVVTIIGILAGIAMVNVQNAQIKAAEAVLKQNLVTMRKAIDDFYADNRRYPTSLDELVEKRYLRTIPKDPITESAETWETIQEDPTDTEESEDSEELTVGPGIIDVKSGAEGKTHDKTPVPYNEL